MAKRRAEVEVTLRDRATAGLKRLSGSFGGLTKAVGLVTAAASALAGIVGARFLVGATRSSGEFAEAMSAVAAVTGASTEELQALRVAADQAGTSTRFTATEAANGLEELARAGQNANQAIATLNPVLNLAAGNQQTVAESAIQVTTALNAFGLEAKEAARVSDVYTRTAQRSAQTTEQLSEAMTFVAPVARQAGLDIEQTAALVGRLADQGFRASLGGTALRNAILQFEDPASSFRRELSSIGIETDNFIEALEGLAEAGSGGEAAIRSLGLRAGPAIQALVAGGAPALQALTQELRNAEGASAEAAAKLEDNLPGALRSLESAYDSARRKLVEPLVDKLTDDVQAFTDLVREFTESDTLSRLQQLLFSTFDAGRTAVTEFINGVDFAEVERSIASFADTAQQKLANFGETVSGFVKGFDTVVGATQIAVGTLRTAFNGLGILISGALDLVVGSFARTAEAVNLVTGGLVGSVSRTADELRLIQQDIRSSTGEFIDAAAEGNAQIVAGFERIANAGQDAGREIKAGTDTAKAGIDEVTQSADNAEGNVERLKTQMFEAGASAESLGLKAKSAADGLEEAANKSNTLAGRWQGLIRAAVGLGEATKAAAERAKLAAEVFPDLGDKGEDGFKRTGKAAGDAAAGVESVGDAAEKTERRAGAAGTAIAGILGSWRTLSEGAAKAVEAFVSSATLNSVQGYFAKLADFTGRMRETQQRQIEEAERLRESYERNGDAVGFLTQAQSLLNREVLLLDSSKVEELERAVDAARASMDEARQSSASLVSELEDDLLRLQGRTEEIEAKRLQRKRDEIRLQLQSNEIDNETRQNLEQALRLMEQKATLQQQQAAESARTAADNQAAANAAEREADAAERTADARNRSSRVDNGTTGRIEIDLRTTASETGAPNFTNSDLANLANQLTPRILQAIRQDLGRGL